MHLSIVSPVYQAENIVEKLVDEIHANVPKITDNYEIILVEDGSPDNSWLRIEEICKEDKKVKGIKLSRNFGQHYAVTAGVEKAKGEVIVIMDCDLQDDPGHILKLHEEYKKGFNIIFTQRIKRKHRFFKYITAKIYNFLFTLFSDRNYDLNVGSLVMFDNKAKEAFLKVQDKDRLYIQILKWTGFKQTYVPVKHRKRADGVSSYSFTKLLKVAVQGWTSHSDRLLKLSIFLGFLITFFSILGILSIVVLYFIKGFQSGWASLMVTMLFSTGIILISIGIAGIYIGKTFEQAKNKPLYIVEKEVSYETK